MQDLPMFLQLKLSSPVNVDVYSSFAQASIGGKKCNTLSVHAGTTVPIYLASPGSNDKHAKNAMLGQYLSGTLTLAKDEAGKKADTYTLKYILNDVAKRDKNGQKSTGGSGSASKKNATESNFAEALADFKIGQLAKMDPNSEDAKTFFADLKKDKAANQLTLRLARASSLDIDRKINLEAVNKEKAEEVVTLTSEILDEVKETDLLQNIGIKYDSRQDATDIKKDGDKQRNILLEALAKRGVALCALGRTDEATDVLFRALKFTEVTDSKIITFAIVHAEQIGHFGRCVKLIQHQLEAKPNTPDLEQKLTKIYEQLGWAHSAYFSKESYASRFPADFEMF